MKSKSLACLKWHLNIIYLKRITGTITLECRWSSVRSDPNEETRTPNKKPWSPILDNWGPQTEYLDTWHSYMFSCFVLLIVFVMRNCGMGAQVRQTCWKFVLWRRWSGQDLLTCARGFPRRPTALAPTSRLVLYFTDWLRELGGQSRTSIGGQDTVISCILQILWPNLRR